MSRDQIGNWWHRRGGVTLFIIAIAISPSHPSRVSPVTCCPPVIVYQRAFSTVARTRSRRHILEGGQLYGT
ncbi:hypothetical protein BC827DRAFT_1232627 [Russula dissimulans]|nr:hypothetical protein BC827DRAFT_1232627 [Russula dissimulans]